MGIYVNPGNDAFAGWVRDELFVDKSGLIQVTNDFVGTADHMLLVSRPRRFGKALAISMLAAYYSRGCDSRSLFRGLAIENDPSFEEHLNKYNVILVQAHSQNARRTISQGKIATAGLDVLEGEPPGHTNPLRGETRCTYSRERIICSGSAVFIMPMTLSR